MTIALVIVLVVSGVALAANAVTTTSNAGTRAVVLFVGDSNIVLSVESVNNELTHGSHFDNGYVPILAARVGAGIRTPDCLDEATCTSWNYWRLKLPTLLPQIQLDAIVSNLGIVDTRVEGTQYTRVYAYYDRKINWFMNIVGSRPVFWTSLPCAIEPRDRQTGCKAINLALHLAVERWPNLHVLKWGTAAERHPEYMKNPGTDVHYSPAGQAAWSKFVVAALDAHFPKP